MSVPRGPRGKDNSPIRAVILDYGEVLCHQPTPEALEHMASIFHYDRKTFMERYSVSRNPYDQGVIETTDYWKKFAKDAGVELSPEVLEKLPLLDIEMWNKTNQGMIDWLEELHEAGFPTALLSNMTHNMKAYMLENYEWLHHFDHHVFSCDLNVIKPSAEIYHRALESLGSKPEETLFIDDREANIEGAQAVGIQGIRFTNIEQLREELEARGFSILPSDKQCEPAIA